MILSGRVRGPESASTSVATSRRSKTVQESAELDIRELGLLTGRQETQMPSPPPQSSFGDSAVAGRSVGGGGGTSEMTPQSMETRMAWKLVNDVNLLDGKKHSLFQSLQTLSRRWKDENT